MEDLQRRFDKVKAYRIEDGLLTNDKAVWDELRRVAVQNQAEALMDDMQEYVDMYQVRINLIDNELYKLGY